MADSADSDPSGLLMAELRRDLGEVLRRLAQQRESEVEEGHLMADHVHIMLSIPPKYSVAQVIGYIKGKSAIHIARHFAGRPRNFVGQHFWARGYFVSTVGRDEQAIRTYIRDHRKNVLQPFGLRTPSFRRLPRPLSPREIWRVSET